MQTTAVESKPWRKRLVRPPKIYLKPIQLQERDVNTILQVDEYGMLDSLQLLLLNIPSAQRTGKVVRNYQERLRYLHHHGYLERPRYQFDRQKPRNNLIYMLGDRGADEIVFAEHPEDRPRKRYAQAAQAVHFNFYHTLAINDFRVALTLALQKHPDAKLTLWRRDGEVHEHAEVLSLRKNQREKVPVKPDGFFVITMAGRDYPFCFEADRSTGTEYSRHDYRDFTKKMLAYWHWYDSGKHEVALQVKHFRVITVAKSRERAKNLARVTGDAAKSEAGKGRTQLMKESMFWFACAEDFSLKQPESILSRFWISPGGGKYGLLP